MAGLGRAEKGAGSDELRVMVAGQAGQNAATDLVGGAAVGGLLKLLGKVYKTLRGVPGVSQAVRDQVENLGPEAVEKLSKKLDDLADAGNLNQTTVKEAVDEVVEAVTPNSTFDLPKTWRSAKGVTGQFSAGAPDRSPVGSHRDTRLYHAYWNMNHWSNCYR